MRLQSTLMPAALAVCTALAVVAAPTAAQASSATTSLPQPSSAQAGATWLAGQLTSEGYIPSDEVPGSPDLSATANTVLALASANVDPSGAEQALAYLAGHVDSYVPADGSDGPGQLALLILDAHATGTSATSFGGTNLVERLLATQQTTGADAGLFGTEAQVNDYGAGVYDQGLALAALAGAGVRSGSAVTSAESWLDHQQCPDGGWTSYENTYNPCDGLPADYEGPDTNSSALAILGLSAQGDLGGKAAGKALKFLEQAQDSDGGWGYEPNAAGAPGSTDPDSTSLVLQAVLALSKSPTKGPFARHPDPVTVVESFQASSGANRGSFSYPGISGPNVIATYQAVPAVAGVVLPFNLYVTTSSLPGGAPRTTYSATLHASGGNAPYAWSVDKAFGSLPSGLKLNRSTGVISGKPRAAGTSTFVVVVTDTKTTSQPRHDNVGWRILSITT